MTEGKKPKEKKKLSRQQRETIATLGSIASVVALPLSVIALLNPKYGDETMAKNVPSSLMAPQTGYHSAGQTQPRPRSELSTEGRGYASEWDRQKALRKEKKQIAKDKRNVKEYEAVTRKNNRLAQQNEITAAANKIGYSGKILFLNRKSGTVPPVAKVPNGSKYAYRAVGGGYMRACPRCGSIFEEGSYICPQCGSADTRIAETSRYKVSPGGRFVNGIPVNRDGYVNKNFMLAEAKDGPGYRQDLARTAKTVYPRDITVDQYRRASRPGNDIEGIDTYGRANVPKEVPKYRAEVRRNRKR